MCHLSQGTTWKGEAMKIPSDLRSAALAAFKADTGWPEFLAEHHDTIKAVAPYNAAKYHKLRDLVRSIVCSGTTDGLYGVGDDDAVSPWEADDDFDPVTVTIAADDSIIDVTLPIHGDPQVERLLIYRTRKNESSPYYYAGFALNGTGHIELNGNDDSLATTDFLLGPVSDPEALAGPFRYGRPPVKTMCEVGMDDVVFVAGEKPYTAGAATGADEDTEITFTGPTVLLKNMEGKWFRFTGESKYYVIETVQTDKRLTLASAYNRPDWRTEDPAGIEYEIIGDGTLIAPSAPGEPEHFCILEEFTIGRNEGGRVKAMQAYGDDVLVWTEDWTYRVSKGYNPGTYNTEKTRSNYGCIAPRSTVVWAGGCIFFTGDEVRNYYNQASTCISGDLGDVLRAGVQSKKGDAISCLMGGRLYLAVSLESEDYLDTIFTLDLQAGLWERWDTFRIVDMQVVTAPSGRQFLYLEVPLESGEYGLFTFTSAAYNDGKGAADYSGDVVSATSTSIETDVALPTTGYALRGLRLTVTWENAGSESRWIESNDASNINIIATEPFTTLPDATCTYTIGAFELELLSGKLSVPDAMVQQSVKHAEISMGD